MNNRTKAGFEQSLRVVQAVVIACICIAPPGRTATHTGARACA
ncbi:MAG: hypothetical protein ACREV1_12065 [Gammaproteobacteria bacterium]